MYGSEKARRRASLNRRELIDARLTRRDLARLGLLTGAGLLVPARGLSARAVNSAGVEDGTPASPPTRPFVEPFRHLDVARKCPEEAMCDNGNVDPATPQKTPNTERGEGRTRTVEHQRFDEFHTANTVYYDVWEREGFQNFHQDLPLQAIWGYGEKQPDGSIRDPKTPGIVVHARYGEPVCWRMHNDLPPEHVGFGIPETTAYLHNGHTASESDGDPLDYFPIGQWYDQHYPNILAGYDQFGPDPVTGLRGDPRETLSTLWFHDH